MLIIDLSFTETPARSWPQTFAFYFLALLLLRGRHRLLFASAASFIAVIFVWAIVRGIHISHLEFPLTVPVLVTAAFSVWLGANHHLEKRELASRRELELSRLRILAEQEAEHEYRLEMERIAEIVRPTLMLMASGEELTPAALREAAVLEAEIRDRIRAPGLYEPILASSISAARRRGATFTLLGGADLGSGSQVSGELATALRLLVDSIGDGHVTIRLTHPGSAAALTVVHMAPQRTARFTFDAEGRMLDRPHAHPVGD